MAIKGGIFTEGRDIILSVSVEGGMSYKRVFNDVVSIAISKFEHISFALNKILVANTSSFDIRFYIEQVKLLLQRAHVEFIQGELPFHDKYNMWLLDGYVRMLLETMDMKLIAQLLNLDSILYSIEEASWRTDNPMVIEFAIPRNIEIKSLDSIDSAASISFPISDDLNAYIQSLNENLMLLMRFIVANKSAFIQIHKEIVSTASKQIKK